LAHLPEIFVEFILFSFLYPDQDIHFYFYLKVQNVICSWWALWCRYARMVKKGLQGTCLGPLVANWWVF